MGIFDVFRRKDRRINYDFDDKDRTIAQERRQMNAQVDAMRRQHQIEEENLRHQLEMLNLKAQIEELSEATGQSESIEDKMGAMLLEKLMQGRPSTLIPTIMTSAPTVEVTDERLRTIWESVPAQHKALLPQCSDAQIKEFLHAQVLPSADDATLDRAVLYARQHSS